MICQNRFSGDGLSEKNKRSLKSDRCCFCSDYAPRLSPRGIGLCTPRGNPLAVAHAVSRVPRSFEVQPCRLPSSRFPRALRKLLLASLASELPLPVTSASHCVQKPPRPPQPRPSSLEGRSPAPMMSSSPRRHAAVNEDTTFPEGAGRSPCSRRRARAPPLRSSPRRWNPRNP